MKEKVRQELQKRTKNHAIQESEVFTAVAIAESLGISRNTVSQYLNQLVKNGKVIKINTRPVYFFDKEILVSANKTKSLILISLFYILFSYTITLKFFNHSLSR